MPTGPSGPAATLPSAPACSAASSPPPVPLCLLTLHLSTPNKHPHSSPPPPPGSFFRVTTAPDLDLAPRVFFIGKRRHCQSFVMLRCDQERRLQCPSSVATATPVRPARWLVTTHGEAPNDGSCPQNLPCVPPGSGVAAILAAQEARAGRTRSAVNAFAPALPLKLAMMMMLVLLYTPCCLAETITCDSNRECQDDTLTCDNSGPCTVLCSGTQACERATITCPADHDCTITCTGDQVSLQDSVQLDTVYFCYFRASPTHSPSYYTLLFPTFYHHPPHLLSHRFSVLPFSQRPAAIPSSPGHPPVEI